MQNVTVIRSYKLADKEELVEIFKLNTPQYFDPKEVYDFKKYLQQHNDTYFTIEYDSKIVGGAGYYVKESDKSGRISWIFFHPEFSGLGLGKKAVEHCLNLLKSNSEVEKLVVTTSQLAYKFFEKFGYKLVQIEKEYWGQGLDLYLMEQELENKNTN